MPQRACYRVRPEAHVRFRLSLELPDGQYISAELLDMSAGGIAARTRLNDCRRLDVGSEIIAIFESGELPMPLRVPAVVTDRQEHGQTTRFGFCFVDRGVLEEGLSPWLFACFNRRHSPRVPVVDAVVECTLYGHEGRTVLGRLHDISVSGPGVIAEVPRHPELRRGERIRVVFRPPTDPAEIDLMAHIRNQHGIDLETTYGIEFDPVSSLDYERHRRLLEHFVEHLQRRRRDIHRVVNRRSAKRARPSPLSPVTVHLWTRDNRCATAELRDISVTGIGLLIPAVEDPEFENNEEMFILCHLPDHDCDLVGRVRRGLLLDDRVLYGLEFEAIATQTYADHRSAIQRFVQHHQPEKQDGPLLALIR